MANIGFHFLLSLPRRDLEPEISQRRILIRVEYSHRVDYTGVFENRRSSDLNETRSTLRVEMVREVAALILRELVGIVIILFEKLLGLLRATGLVFWRCMCDQVRSCFCRLLCRSRFLPLNLIELPTSSSC